MNSNYSHQESLSKLKRITIKTVIKDYIIIKVSIITFECIAS